MMAIWIVLGVLCGGIGGLVTLSMLRPVVPHIREQDYETRSLASALAAIDRDQAGGLLEEGHAVRLRHAIARRFAARTQNTEFMPVHGSQRSFKTDQRRRHACLWGGACALFCLVAVTGFYASLGSPTYSDQTLEQRLRRLGQSSNLGALDEREAIALLEAQLRAVPEDGQGWRVIAPVYKEMGQISKALIAYDNALKYGQYTKKQRAHLAADRIETALSLTQGRVSTKMRAELDRIVALVPDSAKASYMLAMAVEQHDPPARARLAWQEFVTRHASADTPLLPMARARLMDLQRADIMQQAPIAGNPTLVQIDTVGQSSPAARQIMIEGMVARLAAKLARHPDDLPGWERLIHSYVTLGDFAAALAAVERAKTHYAGQEQALARLAVFDALRSWSEE